MRLSRYNAPTKVINGRVTCDPPRAKVAIVAFSYTAPLIRQLQADPAWEIWGLNNGYDLRASYDDEGGFREDRHFELHPISVQPPNDLAWLQSCPVPIYVLDIHDPHPDGPMPNAVQYPLEDAEALVRMPAPFWACTFSYQIALAILAGFREIALIGLDFGTCREWLFERPNVLWWAGFAAGRGISLLVPSASTLLEHGGDAGDPSRHRALRYGYDYHDEIHWCQTRIDALMGHWGYVRRP